VNYLEVQVENVKAIKQHTLSRSEASKAGRFNSSIATRKLRKFTKY